MAIGNSLESLSQQILAGIISVGRLGVLGALEGSQNHPPVTNPERMELQTHAFVK